MRQLIINEYISSLGELKFSAFIKTNAADASNPTTAGRNPLNRLLQPDVSDISGRIYDG